MALTCRCKISTHHALPLGAALTTNGGSRKLPRMFHVQKTLKDFSAAHRLVKGYVGQCADLHGHNYVATITVSSNDLDECGMVIDFNEIKRLCDDWVQRHWDHATLVSEADPELLAFVRAHNQKHYCFEGDVNTTAEFLAKFLFEKFVELLAPFKARLTVEAVDVAETPNSVACYSCATEDKG